MSVRAQWLYMSERVWVVQRDKGQQWRAGSVPADGARGKSQMWAHNSLPTYTFLLIIQQIAFTFHYRCMSRFERAYQAVGQNWPKGPIRPAGWLCKMWKNCDRGSHKFWPFHTILSVRMDPNMRGQIADFLWDRGLNRHQFFSLLTDKNITKTLPMAIPFKDSWKLHITVNESEAFSWLFLYFLVWKYVNFMTENICLSLVESNGEKKEAFYFTGYYHF